jgi:putative ABC transport system substrate-binding protein
MPQSGGLGDTARIGGRPDPSRRRAGVFGAVGVCVGLALLFALPLHPAEAAKKVAIVLSSDSGPYAEAAGGFKDRLAKSGEAADVKTYTLAKGNTASVFGSINNGGYDLVCAIGTTAATAAKENTTVPTVFLLVVDPVGHGIVKDLSRPGGHVTGISLDIPIGEQLDALQDVAPNVKRVGMVCGPSSIATARAGASQAKSRRMELVIESVSSEKAARSAFGKLKGKVDAILALPDPLVYSSASSEAIIMLAIEQRLPFVSYSTNFVKAGALMCLYCEYRTVGEQGAEMARKVLGGRSPSGIPVEAPKETKLAINFRVAESIGLSIGQSVRRKALAFGGR